jgi:nucleoside-diphosphate-sugar epimerase
MPDVLIVGCGDVGARVGCAELEAGKSVMGVVRTEGRAKELIGLGIESYRGDLDLPTTLRKLPAKDVCLYYSAPPPSSGVTDPRMEGLVSVLDAAHRPQRVVLISTTGVYGDCGGAWIDEGRPPDPLTDRARRRLHGENTLLRWGRDFHVPVVILRVAGIYGPGRLPVRRLRERRPVLSEEESPFSNRIQVDDLARVCLAAARKGHAGAVYNVTDGHPTTMTDYIYRVADLLGIPRPPTISLEEARVQLSPGMLSYLAESKRLDNRRMREELGVEPLYPDLTSGLPSCLVMGEED